MTSVAIWHDVECGGYGADLALWRELAAGADGPVLDIGCGTGRVALDLAARGHEVWGVDVEPELVAALRDRAGDLPVTAVCADARDFALERRFALALAPMQTVQLLGGAPGRAAFLERARAHLEPGALLAVALADALEGLDGHPAGVAPPPPDMRELDGVVYSSQPVDVRCEDGATAIERRRDVVEPDGRLVSAVDVVRLDDVSPAELETEARGAGFEPLPARRVAPTAEYVGSDVVMLRA